MKQRLSYLFTALAVLIATIAYSQSGSSSSKGRLDMGKKRDISKAPIGKNTLISNFKPAASIIVKPSSAINAYYRSMLFGEPMPAIATTIAPKTSETSATIAVDSKNKNNGELLLRDGRLFANEKLVVNNIYPNPASEFAEIEYQLIATTSNAKIRLKDVFALNIIGEYPLDKSNGKIRISTHNLPTAPYFYELILDGHVVATKRLAVRH
jgi:hypothetical protein